MRNKIIQASYVSLDIICPCNFGITRMIPFDQGLKYGLLPKECIMHLYMLMGYYYIRINF